MHRIYLGVGLVTFATLMLELLLTRIFSVTLYYHFAFMVISTALFGLGLSGVVLFLRAEQHPRERLPELLAGYSRRFVLSGIVALVFVTNHSLSSSLDAMSAAAFGWQQFYQLSFLYLFSAFPFYYGGMVVSLALYRIPEKTATLYFFDLVGASLACLLLDSVLRLFGGPNAVLATLLVVAAAALLFGGDFGRWQLSRASAWLAAGLALLIGVNANGGVIRVASFKSVDNKALAFSKWNSLSRIEVQERKGFSPDMTIDGQARTYLVSKDHPHPGRPIKGVQALVHAVRPKGRMLIIGPGGGVDVFAALTYGHGEVHLAEINPTILYDVMLGRYKAQTGNLFAQPQVKPHLAEGRHFVRTTKLRFDVIQATLVDTWAATAAGAFALTENHLYTVEAFEDYLEKLTPSGILTMSRWVNVPGMEFVRLAALARSALARRGVKHPKLHTFAAYQGKLATLLVKKTPFTPAEVAHLHQRCAELAFVPLYAPGGKVGLNPVAVVLGTGDPQRLYESLAVDVRPVFDDRPFFFSANKPERIWRDILRWHDRGLNSFGMQVVVAMLGLVLLLVIGAIIVPLWIRQRAHLLASPGSKLRDLGYFACLGVGFILIEIALLQRFTLTLGHPITSLRVVFFGMLFFSGVGSLLSGYVKSPQNLRRLLMAASAAVMSLALLYSLALGSLLNAAIGWGSVARVALSLGLIAPAALLMGMLLPTGLRLLSTRHHEIVPWAWGINGAASVLGSVLAMFLAMLYGFSAVLAIGALLYGVAFVLGARRLGTAERP